VPAKSQPSALPRGRLDRFGLEFTHPLDRGLGLDYIALAIPVFFLLIGVELIIAHLQRRKVYRLNDSVNDLSCGIISQLVGIFGKLILIGIYIRLYQEHRLFTLEPTSIWTWVGCYLAIDFLYYWFHRFSHEVNFLWAAHVVHHQSEEYNLAVALRQSAFQGFFSAPFYWPLALLGFDPVVFATMAAFNTLYQFWIHTRTVGKLGPLEWVLMTPSHHRVHHGRNPRYIDKNHGATFIFWDKLFGTFEEEDEEVYYGITKPLSSWNPVWANLHYWVELWQVAKKTSSRIDTLRVFLAPPGWFPAELGGFQPPPEIGEAPVKFDIALSARLGLYALCQFAIVLGLTAVFLFTAETMPLWLQIVAAGGAVVSLVSIGGLFEGRARYYRLELVRLVGLPLILWLFVAHAGAPFWLIVCAVANLGTAWLLIGRRADFRAEGQPAISIPA